MNEKQLVLASSISLSKIILFEKLYQETFDTVSSGEETLRLPCFIQRNNQRQIETSNASVNSGCAQRPPPPPPLGLTPAPGHQHFFFAPWMGNSREWGLLSCQIPRGRDEKRGQIPRPPSKLQHFSLISQSSSCYFNERFFVSMNDFPVIGYPCFAHRILGSPGGKHCESPQRNVWRGVVSPVKAVSLDIECNILP